MTTIAPLLVIAGFSWAIYHYAPLSSGSSGGRGPFRLEQFRPAAPLAGLFSDDADAERQYRDLVALQAHLEDSDDLDHDSGDGGDGGDSELGRAA